MSGTKIENINKNNTDVADIIDEVLQEDNPKPQVTIQEKPIVHEYIPIEPIYQNKEEFKKEIPNDSLSYNLTKSLQKTIILFILLLVLTNPHFKKIIGKIPFTLTENGDTFLMTIISSLIICVCFYIIDYFL